MSQQSSVTRAPATTAPHTVFQSGSLDLLRLPAVNITRVVRDTDAFAREHARDRPRRAADFYSCAAQTPEHFDAGPVHEANALQIEADSRGGPKKIGAFAPKQGHPLPDDTALEPERRPGA
jgi:hypothetical protein